MYEDHSVALIELRIQRLELRIAQVNAVRVGFENDAVRAENI